MAYSTPWDSRRRGEVRGLAARDRDAVADRDILRPRPFQLVDTRRLHLLGRDLPAGDRMTLTLSAKPSVSSRSAASASGSKPAIGSGTPQSSGTANE